MQKQVKMSSLLPIMHYPCFHYDIVITHYYMLPTGQLADAYYSWHPQKKILTNPLKSAIAIIQWYKHMLYGAYLSNLLLWNSQSLKKKKWNRQKDLQRIKWCIQKFCTCYSLLHCRHSHEMSSPGNPSTLPRWCILCVPSSLSWLLFCWNLLQAAVIAVVCNKVFIKYQPVLLCHCSSWASKQSLPS